ncbi:head protein [Helicobacter valdiviensis]|uniref:Head protein n=1 Tax=Helicobacter valdiviensis TaxID=1458358 RepID=A0A2W6MRQ1_9HELI|nr:Mu-like prophage major head subunit gpT family protein [Helicobacter valdiviensis]PZT47235.1 head protein [Helicobacter valdiviensis]
MAFTELTPEYMKAVSKGFSTIFNNALEKGNKDYEKLAMTTNVNSMVVEYQFLASLPKMREWIGDRQFSKLKGQGYTITKKDWESSIEVPRDVITYDNLGVVRPQIEALAYEVHNHYNDLIFTLLEQNQTCFDGKAFFATDHDIGGVSFSNLGDKELNAKNLMEARKNMRALTNESGRTLNINPNLLVVPLSLEARALEIVNSDLINGTSNVFKGVVEVYTSPNLSDQDAWYLFDTTKPIKAIILQINKGAEFVAKDNPTDEAAFMRKAFQYGIDSEDNAGYGLWQLAYKSSGKVKENTEASSEEAQEDIGV